MHINFVHIEACTYNRLSRAESNRTTTETATCHLILVNCNGAHCVFGLPSPFRVECRLWAFCSISTSIYADVGIKTTRWLGSRTNSICIIKWIMQKFIVFYGLFISQSLRCILVCCIWCLMWVSWVYSMLNISTVAIAVRCTRRYTTLYLCNA